MVDGEVAALEKARTANRALGRLADLAVEAAGGRQVQVAVQHLDAPARAEEMAARLSDQLHTDVVVCEVGAVMGVHVGPGWLRSPSLRQASRDVSAGSCGRLCSRIDQPRCDHRADAWVDYRAVGSGNPGATNIGRALGRKTGVAVALLDILKGFLPAIVFVVWSGEIAVAEAAGFAAVPGMSRAHSSRAGAARGGDVNRCLPGHRTDLVVARSGGFGVVFGLSRRMGIASVSAALALIPASIVWHPEPSEIVFATALAGLIVLRHQSNIRAALASRRAS